MFKSRSKFRNKKIIYNDLKFDSKKELERWLELNDLQERKVISNLQRQVKFEVLPKQQNERAVTYIADHTYLYGNILVVEDVKSKITKKQPEYIIKRKLFKYFYCSNKEKIKEKFNNLDIEMCIFKEIE